MKPKISILLPAYKSEDLLEKLFLLGFFSKSSDHWKPAPSTPLNYWHGPELILYDNGGNGDLKTVEEFLNVTANVDYPTCKVIGDGKNIGLNAALNECAKVATGDWFYLPHTDMYLMPGWDTALLEAVKNHPPGKQLLCSRSIEPTKGHTDYHIIKDYGREHHEFKEERLLEDFANYKDSSIVVGKRMPFFLHRTLWEKMNGVDPNYFSYCTDDDLIQTAYDVGVRQFWMVYDSLVYHLVGKSNAQQTVDRDSQRPYIYFVEKWRKRGYLDARHPGQWHPELIPDYVKIR